MGFTSLTSVPAVAGAPLGDLLEEESAFSVLEGEFCLAAWCYSESSAGF